MNKEQWRSDVFAQILSRRSIGTRYALSEVTRESKTRNAIGLDSSHVMGVDRDRGILPMREQTIGSSLERYKILRPGAFAYNPMRLNIGSIARWTGEHDVLVSGDYVVFETLEEKLDARYLDHLRHTPGWKRFITTAGAGSVRVRIYFDNLAEMRLTLPPVSEQKRIADLIESFDGEIVLLQKLRDIFKQGLIKGVV